MITLPFINVRNLVVFPGMETALVIGRDASIRAIEKALKSKDKHLAVISQQRSEQNDNVGISEMYPVGTVCEVERSVRMDDAMKIFVVGKFRIKIEGTDESNGVRTVMGSEVPATGSDKSVSASDRKDTSRLIHRWCAKLRDNADESRTKSLDGNMENYLACAVDIISYYDLAKKNPASDLVNAAKRGLGLSYQECFDVNKDTINVMVAGRQKLLEETDAPKALEFLRDLLRREVEMFAETEPPV